MKSLKVTRHINNEEACKNICYYNKSDFAGVTNCYISIKHYILYCEHRDYVKHDEIKINKVHRIELNLLLTKKIQVSIIDDPQNGCKTLDTVDLVIYRKKHDGLQPLYVSQTKFIKKFLEIMENKIIVPKFLMGITYDEKLLFIKIIIQNYDNPKYIITKDTKFNIVILDKKMIKLQIPKIYTYLPIPDCEYIYDIKIECIPRNRDYIKYIICYLGKISYSIDIAEYHPKYPNIIKFPLFEQLGAALPIYGLLSQIINFHIHVDTCEENAEYKIHYKKVCIPDLNKFRENRHIEFTTSNLKFVYNFGYMASSEIKQNVIKSIGFSIKKPDSNWIETGHISTTVNTNNKIINHNLPDIQNKKIFKCSYNFKS